MKRVCRWLLILIGITLLGLTFSSPLSPYAARSLQQVWQLGHILLFGVWTWLLFPGLEQRVQRSWLRFGITIIVTVSAGLLIEFLQAGIGREFSLRDVLNDLIGSLLVLCAFMLSGRLLMPRLPARMLYGLTLLLGLYTLAPLAIAVVDEINMYRHFPRLDDFDSVLETGRWRGDVKIVRLLSARGDDRVLRIQLGTSHYSGVSLAHFPGNWRAERQLKFELFNPGRTPLALSMRIHDDQHYTLGKGEYYDRFNRVLRLRPGWNRITVAIADVASAPASRTLDLKHIQALGFFSVDLPRPRTVYIDQLRLVP